MRTDDERIAAMHARAEEIKGERRKRRVRIWQSVSFVTAFAAVILLAVLMPGLLDSGTVPGISSLSDPDSSGGTAPAMSGSIFAESGAMGYVVIAVIAFLLGVCVTAFCFRLKKWNELRKKTNRH